MIKPRYNGLCLVPANEEETRQGIELWGESFSGLMSKHIVSPDLTGRFVLKESHGFTPQGTFRINDGMCSLIYANPSSYDWIWIEDFNAMSESLGVKDSF